jgi:hypothetical protein
VNKKLEKLENTNLKNTGFENKCIEKREPGKGKYKIDDFKYNQTFVQ